jgi:hypothetical protein
MARSQTRPSEFITTNNYTLHVVYQRQRAARIAAATRARGIVILTSLTPEQREADKLDELLTWPARWTS